MTKYKKQSIKNTFKNASNGFRLSLKSERNLRIHMIAALIVLFAAYYFNFNMTKYAILLLTITSVMAAEMFNASIEFTLDATFHNKYSKMVGMAKDIAAGAVMLITITAIIIGIILFIPPFLNMIK